MQARSAGWFRFINSWGMPLVIFGLVLACYGPALNGGILWDDPAHIPRPELRSWAGLGRIWTDMRATQQYYPVLFSAFWLEHRLWGDSTFCYHLVNVILHAASCCVLAALLRRIWAMPKETVVPPGTEWFAAALFAVHPVGVESVAWITEQKNTLSLLFYLLAGWAYLRFVKIRSERESESEREGEKGRKGPGNERSAQGAIHSHSHFPFPSRAVRAYALASVLFILAIGSKTVTVTLPAALLVVLWWKHGRLLWRRDILPLAPWFAFAGATGAFVSWFERKWIGAEGAGFDFSLPERVLLAGRVFWFYLGKVVWPADLIFYYPRWDVTAESGSWIGWVIALVLVTASLWALALRGRGRGLLAGWLLYLGGLAPFLGFFNAFYFNFSFVADHSQYHAMLSLVAAVVSAAAAWLACAAARVRWVTGTIGVIVVVILAVLSNQQSALYINNETLFRANIARNPSAWMAHQNLAITLARSAERRQEAIAEFREVLRLKPDHPDAHYGLGVELARLPGRKAEAIAEFEKAIELRPIYAEAHNALGLELARQAGREMEAIAHFEAALRVKPQLADVHANLADVLVKFPERLPEAMAQYAEALHLNPNLAWVHCHLAFQLARLPGRQDEALAHYEQALRIEPNSIDAHNGLAIAYIIMNRPADARREWETVLRLDPTQDAVRRNLRRLDEMEGR